MVPMGKRIQTDAAHICVPICVVIRYGFLQSTKRVTKLALACMHTSLSLKWKDVRRCCNTGVHCNDGHMASCIVCCMMVCDWCKFMGNHNEVCQQQAVETTWSA